MSNEFIADIGSYRGASGVTGRTGPVKDKTQLDMTDFLTLMVKEMTSQSIDSNMDTSDMLNQLVQMQMVQAMTNMTDASIMSYSASLVGKEVTVGQYNADGTLQEIVGTVTGTGVLDGNQVVFIGDKYYRLNEIMAVGRLPERETPPEVKPEVKPEGGTEGTPESGPENVPGETPEPEAPPEAYLR